MNNNTSEKKNLTEEALKDYTTADVEKIIAEFKTNKFGFPSMLPQKNALGKTVLLSFYKAKIKGLDGDLLDEEEATFDILDNEVFDKDDKLALTNTSLSKISNVASSSSNKSPSKPLILAL